MCLNKKISAFFICVAGLYSIATAQAYVKDSYGNCVSVSLDMGMGQYRGEYHGFRQVLKTWDMNVGYGLKVNFNFDNDYVHSKFNERFDKYLSVFLSLHMLSFSSDLDRMDLKLDGKVFETALGANINLLRFTSNPASEKQAHIWTPYITLGVALSGVKTSIPDLSVDDASFRFFPSVLLGGGLKLTVTKGFILGLEGGLRFTTTDDMDYSTTMSGNDLYYFGGLSATFNIGELFFK